MKKITQMEYYDHSNQIIQKVTLGKKKKQHVRKDSCSIISTINVKCNRRTNFIGVPDYCRQVVRELQWHQRR